MRRRLMTVIAAIAAMIALTGCGRVDLEDLTPEAFRTQQAATATAIASRPTATPGTGGSTGSVGTPGSGGSTGGGLEGADVQAGNELYDFQCSGCHEGGRRAQPIEGKTYDPAEIIPKLRSGEGFGAPHPSFKVTDITPLTDSDIVDILAYLASAQ